MSKEGFSLESCLIYQCALEDFPDENIECFRIVVLPNYRAQIEIYEIFGGIKILNDRYTTKGTRGIKGPRSRVRAIIG